MEDITEDDGNYGTQLLVVIRIVSMSILPCALFLNDTIDVRGIT